MVYLAKAKFCRLEKDNTRWSLASEQTSCVLETLKILKLLFLENCDLGIWFDLGKWHWPWNHQMCIDEMCLHTKYEPCN